MRWYQTLLFLSIFTARIALADDTVSYTVVAGDSCGKIAKKFFGASARYDLIHKYNQLGPTPHKLKPGTILILPAAKSDADAVLTQKKGDVEARSPDSNWADAKRGQDLFKAWKVGAKEAASAEITFRDDSAIYMRENTVVVIYGDTSSSTKKTEASISEATLEKGTLRSRLDELSGKKVVINTLSSKTDLTGGTSIISVDETNTTRVANHEGKSAKVTSNDVKGASVTVKPGMGSKVEPKKAPSKPKPLPQTPVWKTSDITLLSYDGTANVYGEWLPVAVADSYQLELLQGKEVIKEITTPGNAATFDFQKLPVGIYQVRVSAIDSDKFEGNPSKKLTISIISLATSPASTDLSAYKILVGSYFVAPDGFLCSVPGGQPSQKIKAQQAGDLNILCANKTITLEEIRLRAYEVKSIVFNKVGIFFTPSEFRL
jgi:hypothetical protein